ncbi:MAG: UbiA family prenyltransferase [Candidatus Altiarchaeota archaeon]
MKLSEIVCIYRFKNWYYYLGFILLGLILKKSIAIEIYEILKYALVACFLLAYAYSLNDYFDKKQNRKFFIAPLILVVLSFPFLNFYQLLISSFFLILVSLYSSKKFRLKAVPIISSLSNGFGFLSLFFIGYFHSEEISLLGILFAALLFFFEMVAQFVHEIVDFEEDKRSGIMTTAIFLGERKIRILSICFLITTIAVAFSIWNFSKINFLFLLSNLIFSTYFILQFLSRRKIDLEFRVEYKNFGIVVGIFWVLALLL